MKNRLTNDLLFSLRNKLKVFLVLLLLPVLFMPTANASSRMNETLIQIINQLQAIKPLLAKAEREQAANPRIKVHFDKFIGPDGKYHSGIRQDIDAIQKALINIVNKETVEPRQYKEIKGDFVGQL